MSKSKYEKHIELINKVKNAYNDLPIEERMKIRTFIGQEKLATIWQVITMCKDDLSPKVKRNIIKYADDIEKIVREDFRLYQMAHSPKVDIEEEIQKIDMGVKDE